MTSYAPRLPFKLDPLIAEAKRRARQRRLLLLMVAVLIAGAAIGASFAVHWPNGSGGASATVAFHRVANPSPVDIADCGRGIPGQGFHAFACMSGGARLGHPHPKELYVLRSDGSSVAYPAFRVGFFAVGDGEVVATFNIDLVRVTSSRLVPLLTQSQLARALHIRPLTIDDIYAPSVDTRGDIYFAVSIINHGCQNRRLELTSGGAIRQLWASSNSRSNTCG